MHDTLRRLPCGSLIGWSVFADYRALPLTLPVEVCSHYEELLASLDMIDGRMRWANASNIGKGVASTVRSAKSVGSGVNVVFITERATGSRRTSRIDQMRRWIRSQGCCHVRSVIAASGALAEADAVGAAVASALELAERSSDVASLRGSDALAGPSP